MDLQTTLNLAVLFSDNHTVDLWPGFIIRFIGAMVLLVFGMSL